jgi:hypothetical protein
MESAIGRKIGLSIGFFDAVSDFNSGLLNNR